MMTMSRYISNLSIWTTLILGKMCFLMWILQIIIVGQRMLTMHLYSVTMTWTIIIFQKITDQNFNNLMREITLLKLKSMKLFTMITQIDSLTTPFQSQIPRNMSMTIFIQENTIIGFQGLILTIIAISLILHILIKGTLIIISVNSHQILNTLTSHMSLTLTSTSIIILLRMIVASFNELEAQNIYQCF